MQRHVHVGGRGVSAAHALPLGHCVFDEILMVLPHFCHVARIARSISEESVSRVVAPRLDEGRRKPSVQAAKVDGIHAQRDSRAANTVRHTAHAGGAYSLARQCPCTMWKGDEW